MQTTETEIRDFWNANPCGEYDMGRPFDGEAFFHEYDAARYRAAPHILECLDAIDWRGKEVLEVGLGQGADSEQIIRRGAHWTGLDLTPESVRRVTMRLQGRGLPYRDIRCGSITSAPFPDRSFDIIFSHGVLHHIPDIAAVSRELARLLKPDGELIVMLYARWSINYAATLTARRALLVWRYLRGHTEGPWGVQVALARKMGLLRYLRTDNFLSRNTDGPENPHSRVYDRWSIRRDFPQFRLVRAYKHYLYPPPLPPKLLGLERLCGWHLWAHLKPQASE